MTRGRPPITPARRAEQIAETLLAELPRRRDHVRGVARRAEELATRISDDDAVTVVTAAWLHDIGYSPQILDTGFHPVDGARFLRAQRFPDLVVCLVAHHTGAEAEAEERGLAAQLREFARPPEALLDLVTCADMQTGPQGDRVDAQERVTEILQRYPAEHPVHRAVTRSAPALLAAVDRIRSLER
ncbi:HD domain-containing protein [Tsukamurella hominis]|uniref:HD domain-containing protein n=1 Tax=Tsukamurella hominis TaxID=1970232 RepID=UPI0039E85764